MIDVIAAIIESGGRYLIGRRKKGKLKGKWEFPGGKLEGNETCEEFLVRELDEEFGVKVKVGRILSENVHDYGWAKIRLVGYYAEHVSGEFRLTDHDRIEWVLPNEFEGYDFAPADIPFVKKLVEEYSK